ncbi:hypothetical protein QBC46DRAFT_422660 [Diplogelasinospora grovesii]|uniref:FAD-binding PCMH-type domain-containing protein n=1 Tax=Diplogelasinospora grovesii TaxID=303347 RepID=A0AAN6N0U9_9PEZI|nr:hypothetical protein QBC46DRAFT_422660 [Diplogelasinospora grovesii]
MGFVFHCPRSETAWHQPTCIAQPDSAQDVQTLVKAVVGAGVPFAIRSGGHDPAPFDASISTGVLISMSQLNNITYDATNNVVSIGPGARWGAVYSLLDSYNVTAVGGRVMDVGVGGFYLGGGLSYLTDLYGMACDNVQSFEVVLANGSLVDACATSHSDLFWALKGGANNFGIVTKFTVSTYPIKQGWGGLRGYTYDQLPKVLAALDAYQTKPDKDLYANLIIDVAAANQTEYGVLVTFIYLKPVANPAAYAPFYNITPVIDETGFATLYGLMADFPSPPLPPRHNWYATSFEPSPTVFAGLAALLSTNGSGAAPEVAALGGVEAGSLVVTVQPIAAHVAGVGGNNALGLRNVTQTWIALDMSWDKAADDGIVNKALEGLLGRVQNLTVENGVALEYVFMNDASWDQGVIASYGKTSVDRLRDVQRVYDPCLVFQKLVPGGQKIP